MAEGGSDEVVENTICGLCSETYRQPKLLPCFHTFCLSCLETHVEHIGQDAAAFDCPLCETKIDLPEDGVKGFQSNIYLPRSAAYFIHEETHDCDLCGPHETAINHCTACEESYCERCSGMHLKQKATRTHTLIPLSASDSGPNVPLKKKQFCANHPDDELRVVCKDCNDELLCILCKLTDHEKHKSREIANEAKTIKESITGNIQKNDKVIKELHEIHDIIKHADNEESKRKESYLEVLDRFRNKLQELIETRTNAIREMVVRAFEYTSWKNNKSVSEIKAIIKTLDNLSTQVNQVAAVNDDVFVIRNASNVRTVASKTMEQAGKFKSKREKLILSTQDQFRIRTDIDHVISQLCNKLVNSCLSVCNEKEVSVISKVFFYKTMSTDQVGSISTVENVCSYSRTYIQSVAIGSSSKLDFKGMWPNFKELVCCISINSDYPDYYNLYKCFYSVLNTKELKVRDDKNTLHEVLSSFHMYPHGIACRLYKHENEEILVCVLDDSNILSTKVCKGMVKVIPTAPGRDPYDFIAETTPAPTRVAVNKHNGLVCLSYPCVGKIAVHFEDGTVMHSLEGANILPGIDKGKFTPFGICFDNDNCIIIADRDGAKVLRVSVFGELIQVLLEGNKPTAVAVDVDDKLWVGYEDKNVTVYQMKNE